MFAVERGEHLADLAAERGHQRKLRHFDDRDADAAVSGTRGDLEADPPGANDGQRGTFGQCGIQRIGVVDGAQVVHAVGVGAGDRRSARLRASGQQKLVVVHRAAVGQGDCSRFPIDCRHLGALLQVDVVVAVPGRGGDGEVTEVLFPCQVLL